jgi:outer membrane protein TolC
MPVRVLLAVILAIPVSFAQISPFPRPSYFREVYSRPATTVQLQDPLHLKDFVVNGRLELSLKHYLELVMANNTDVQIQLLSLETPRNAIMRALSTWDPMTSASFSDTRSSAPSVTALAGASTSISLSQPASFAYSQTLPSGTQYTVGFTASKNSTNSTFATLNPYISSGLSIGFSQPLIRNRGYYVNHINLMMARSRYRISDYTLRNQLLQMVNTAENAYWDLVQARENLRVAESARKLADDSLKLSQKELELGALSPLDIYNPEQQLATADLGVSQAKFALEQTENALRKQIGADLDPAIRKLPVELTEPVETTVASGMTEPEQEAQKAMQIRPDLKAAMQALDVDELGIGSARNELLPNLTVSASYQTQGIGGVFYPSSTTLIGGTAQSLAPIPGGFGDSLTQLFGFGYPVYSFGLNLSLPIRSHAAAADMADALVQKKRDALTIRTTQQQIRLSILNAVSNVRSSQESVKLALVAKDFAAKYLDAENQKYQLGIDPMQFVLQAQNSLTQAESNVVQAQVGLRRNVLNLLTQTGELLDERGIVVQ